ncbi:MAG: tetratricopeptide repeat protein [Leptolyngbyaceae cyanobacterium bins.349]|nr:tetratricopeptide repeat protein [Leptolyngbyaceae cyanobacterium bins.349]
MNVDAFTLKLNGIILTLVGLLLLPSAAIAQPRFQNLKDPNYWIQLCNALSKTKPAEALSACERAIELRPGDAGLWSQYGTLQLQLKQYPESLAAFDQALRRQANNSQVLTDQCIALTELVQKEMAVAACEKALKVNANWGSRAPITAQRYRAINLDTPKAYEEAIAFYDQALTKEPQDSLALLYRGEALKKLGRPPSVAIASYQRALEGNGNFGNTNPAIVWNTQALTLKEAGELELAVKSLDRALQLNPKDAATWLQLGNTLRQLRRPTEALTAYNRTLELQPTWAQALLAQCTTLNHLRQAEAALAACQKAIQSDDDWGTADSANAWNQQSVALAMLNKPEEALAAANRAVGMRPDLAIAWSDRAVILWYLKRYPEALASVQQAINLNNNDARSWANLGRILRSLNQPERALAAYNEALQRNPQDAMTWANLSAVQWSLGDHPNALTSANQAISVNPKLIQGWQNRAIALVALKNYPDAQHSYERVIELDKTNADAWTGLGLVFAQQRQVDKALQALQTAVTLNPQQAIAQQALKALTETQPKGAGSERVRE